MTDFPLTGWVCPRCNRVYSPTTPMCLYCGSNDYLTPTSIGDSTIIMSAAQQLSFLDQEGINKNE